MRLEMWGAETHKILRKTPRLLEGEMVWHVTWRICARLGSEPLRFLVVQWEMQDAKYFAWPGQRLVRLQHTIFFAIVQRILKG